MSNKVRKTSKTCTASQRLHFLYLYLLLRFFYLFLVSFRQRSPSGCRWTRSPQTLPRCPSGTRQSASRRSLRAPRRDDRHRTRPLWRDRLQTDPPTANPRHPIRVSGRWSAGRCWVTAPSWPPGTVRLKWKPLVGFRARSTSSYPAAVSAPSLQPQGPEEGDSGPGSSPFSKSSSEADLARGGGPSHVKRPPVARYVAQQGF